MAQLLSTTIDPPDLRFPLPLFNPNLPLQTFKLHPSLSPRTFELHLNLSPPTFELHLNLPQPIFELTFSLTTTDLLLGTFDPDLPFRAF